MNQSCLFNMTVPVSNKAMDLSLHVKIDCGKTIFEDAENFARNNSYKLVPITLECINEAIIQTEHNYCNLPSIREDCFHVNANMVNEPDERNYKKLKNSCLDNSNICRDNERNATDSFIAHDFSEGYCERLLSGLNQNDDHTFSLQPLDLSSPIVIDRKNDRMLKEKQSNIPETKHELRASPELKPFSVLENKENVKTSTKKLEVTISRPGQKEYYQPCEIFLNDIARISPDLIKNDCYEIHIIDHTQDGDIEKDKLRTYYIVSQSTWRTFENSTERIILTNDLNIGEPIQTIEKFDTPTFLIFDQYSLTESLAKICERKGGRFEYTCIEESMEVISNVSEKEAEKCSSGEIFDKVRGKQSPCIRKSNAGSNLRKKRGQRGKRRKKFVSDDESRLLGNHTETKSGEELLLNETQNIEVNVGKGKRFSGRFNKIRNYKNPAKLDKMESNKFNFRKRKRPKSNLIVDESDPERNKFSNSVPEVDNNKKNTSENKTEISRINSKGVNGKNLGFNAGRKKNAAIGKNHSVVTYNILTRNRITKRGIENVVNSNETESKKKKKCVSLDVVAKHTAEHGRTRRVYPVRSTRIKAENCEMNAKSATTTRRCRNKKSVDKIGENWKSVQLARERKSKIKVISSPLSDRKVSERQTKATSLKKKRLRRCQTEEKRKSIAVVRRETRSMKATGKRLRQKEEILKSGSRIKGNKGKKCSVRGNNRKNVKKKRKQ